MRISATLMVVVAVAVWCARMQAVATDACQVKILASIDMGTDTSGGVYVPMTIEGREEKLLIDTGGVMSSLRSAVADELQLPRKQLGRYRLRMFGGFMLTQYAVADTVRLGTMTGKDWNFVVMPDAAFHPDLAGTLAPDLLRDFDVDFDFAKGKVNFISPNHCPGNVVYWTQQPYARIPITTDRIGGHITLTTVLDGKEIQATLDTGSSRSLLGLEHATSLFDWGGKTPDLKPEVRQDDGGLPDTYRHPFRTLTFEGVTVANPDIALVPKKVARMGDVMLVGMGILRQLHLYIAYREGYIYATGVDAH